MKCSVGRFGAVVAVVVAVTGILAVGASSPAHAFNGDIQFTPEEVSRHQSNIRWVAERSSACLKETLKTHEKFFRKYGISPYYGDRSGYQLLGSEERRKEYLASMGVRPELAEQMMPTSCVGMTLKCLGEGFEAIGQKDVFERIHEFTKANALDGTALQLALQKLGWRVLYWNPDPNLNDAWDQMEKTNDPSNAKRFWGYHQYRYTILQRTGKYNVNPVDDATTLVGFGDRPPKAFRKIPFFVGTAHTGYHVFPGFQGKIIEAHSMRSITDKQTVETSDFNPLANGGGPRGNYFTGLVAVPPGYGL